MRREHASRKFKRRMCEDKQRHRDHDEAVRAAHSVMRKRGHTVRPYECPFCKGWHLTRNEG